ncbi:MAG: hypothetical protein JKX70_06020 [Phycisphaerales bacterium]|nr:hypothetical protein [Phycisphaerales bacterium]
MSDCSPEHDLYECIQHEDITLWFAAKQIGDVCTARIIIERFLKHALVSLHRDGQPTQDWEWRAIFDDPNNWDQSHTSAQAFILVATGDEQRAESFFRYLHNH